MGTEGVYVKKEYDRKVMLLARRLKKEESVVRQYCLELGVDVLLELSAVN